MPQKNKDTLLKVILIQGKQIKLTVLNIIPKNLNGLRSDGNSKTLEAHKVFLFINSTVFKQIHSLDNIFYLYCVYFIQCSRNNILFYK